MRSVVSMVTTQLWNVDEAENYWVQRLLSTEFPSVSMQRKGTGGPPSAQGRLGIPHVWQLPAVGATV